MYYGKVEICGVNTSKLKNLSENEKKKLLNRFKNGDMLARDELISGNLRLVLSIIQRFACRGENMDDLFQVGVIGLIKAVDNFDPSLDLKFSTYAVPMIIGEVRRYLRDNNTIRVSRSVRDLAYKSLQIKERLYQNSSEEPSVDLIVQELNKQSVSCTRQDVISAFESIMEPLSLFEPMYNSDGAEGSFLMDQICDEGSNDDAWIENIAINDALKKLSYREKSIINKRFFEGRTQTEIADEIGISQAQVSRLEKTALSKIKKQL